MSEEKTVAKLFWKAIATIPSKARFDGFQLAAVGRFGRRWQKILLNTVKILLLFSEVVLHKTTFYIKTNLFLRKY